jgi:regulator of sigma E protease
MNLMVDGLNSLFVNVAPFFILLGLLIFVHELGHFLVAKYYGVRVETFSLGFGKKIFSFKRGDTVYCLSLIPLGGYVKMYGDDPNAEVPGDQKQYAFLHKPVMQRVAVVLAGPLMNLAFAVLIFTVIAGIGEELPGPFVGDVTETSKAYDAGFRSGDKILSIDGEQIPAWTVIKKKIERAPGKMLEFVVERRGETEPRKVAATATEGDNENIFSSKRKVGQIEGLGMESRSTLIGVTGDSPAAKAGIKSLDLITAVGGQKINYWRELEPALRAALAGKPSGTVAVDVRDVDQPDKPQNVRSHSIDISRWDEKKSTLTAWAGFEPAELYIYQLKKGSPAEKAGVQKRDKVVKINGEDVHVWNDVLNRVKGFDTAAGSLKFTVNRDGKEFSYDIQPEMTKLMTMKGQEERRFTIGIVSGFLPAGPEPVFIRVSNPIAMVKEGIIDTATWTEFVVMSLVRLVQGEVSPKNVGGVITIGRVASHSFAAGLSTFLRTMAIISINLFLLNLLPVPVLDGGHLLFYAIEGVKGAPLSMKKMELAQQIGLMLLMILMVFAFFNDITNLLNRW